MDSALGFCIAFARIYSIENKGEDYRNSKHSKIVLILQLQFFFLPSLTLIPSQPFKRELESTK